MQPVGWVGPGEVSVFAGAALEVAGEEDETPEGRLCRCFRVAPLTHRRLQEAGVEPFPHERVALRSEHQVVNVAKFAERQGLSQGARLSADLDQGDAVAAELARARVLACLRRLWLRRTHGAGRSHHSERATCGL